MPETRPVAVNREALELQTGRADIGLGALYKKCCVGLLLHQGGVALVLAHEPGGTSDYSDQDEDEGAEARDQTLAH